MTINKRQSTDDDLESTDNSNEDESVDDSEEDYDVPLQKKQKIVQGILSAIGSNITGALPFTDGPADSSHDDRPLIKKSNNTIASNSLGSEQVKDRQSFHFCAFFLFVDR